MRSRFRGKSDWPTGGVAPRSPQRHLTNPWTGWHQDRAAPTPAPPRSALRSRCFPHPAPRSEDRSRWHIGRRAPLSERPTNPSRHRPKGRRRVPRTRATDLSAGQCSHTQPLRPRTPAKPKDHARLRASPSPMGERAGVRGSPFSAPFPRSASISERGCRGNLPCSCVHAITTRAQSSPGIFPINTPTGLSLPGPQNSTDTGSRGYVNPSNTGSPTSHRPCVSGPNA